jgi:hypothetical protein
MAPRWAALGTFVGLIALGSLASADPAPPTVAARVSAPDSTAVAAVTETPQNRRVIPLPETVVRGTGMTVVDGGFKFQLPAREASGLPGGFADPTRMLQALPGVSNDSDFDGLLYVRGGDAGQNRILLDDVNVSDAYHFGGVVSVLNVDVIDRLEFMPGGFTAAYGDAMSSVLQVRRRIGNPVRFSARSAVNALTGSAALEGPLGGDGKGSWLVAGRRSIIGELLRGRASGETVIPAYWDVDARLWRKVGENDFRFGFLTSGDFLSARVSDTFEFAPAESSGIEWDRHLTVGSLNWERAAGAWGLTSVVAYGWRSQEIDLLGTVPQFARAETRQFDWRGDAKRPAGGVVWSGGAQVVHRHTDYDLDINRLSILEPDRRSNPRSPLDTTEVESKYEARSVYLAGYGQGEFGLFDSTLSVTAGLRFERSNGGDEKFSPSPRLRMLWRAPWTGWTVNGAVGTYLQYPGDRLEVDPSFGNPDLGPERANHYVLGVSHAFARGGRVSLEGYAKDLDDLIVADPDAGEGQPAFVNTGTGTAHGVEFLLHMPRRQWDGWAAYTLGRVRYRDFEDGREYAPAQDIRHTVSLVGRWKPNEQWTVGAKWRAQSGRPYTPVVGRVNVSDIFDGLTWLPVLGEFNSGRFPWYERLDVRAERAFRISGARCTASVEVVNLLGRRNLYDYRYVDGYGRAETVTMLPMVPTIGFTAAF